MPKYAEVDSLLKVNRITEIQEGGTIPPNCILITGDIPTTNMYYHVLSGTFSKTPSDHILHHYRQEFNCIRSQLFDKYDWVTKRHAQRVDGNIPDPTYGKWITYFEALRNMPEQDDFDPMNLSWPTPPEE